MNQDQVSAALILIVPLFGLFAICRDGKWNWDPVRSEGAVWLQTPLIHRFVLFLFWLGWSVSLLVGLLKLFDVA